MTILEDLAAKSQLHWSDYIVLIAYFVIVIGVGIWSSCLNRGSVGGYFLAGRNMNWVLVGASLFASNIGSGHFIGLAGSGAASGVAISIFELSAIFILLLLGWVFVPVYITSGVYTMPEYLKKRFGGERIRVYLAVLAVILYVFTKVSADLFAGAVFIEQSLGWNIWGAIIALLILAMVFTIGGGLSAVIWTDFVQVFIMIIGAFVLMVISFTRIGGYAGLEEKFLGPEAWPNFTRQYVDMVEAGQNVSDHMETYAKCGMTNQNAFHLMRRADDSSLPWPGIMFGLTISSVWYWCSDQVIVQRALAAKNLVHAKAGTVLAGSLKLLPMFIMVFPGMISRLLYPELVACADPDSCKEICGNPAGCTNIAYPLLVVKLMPNGARGLMLAVMMSALMSSLTSIFNSSSTIFTMDIWRRLRKNSSDMELMIVGRVFVLAIVAVSIAWIPIIQNISELFHYIQGITSFLAPPVCAVYVLGILWKRINEQVNYAYALLFTSYKHYGFSVILVIICYFTHLHFTHQGAFWGLMVGLVVGMIRFIWEFSYGPAPPCGEEDTRHPLIANVHYLHFGILLFGIVVIVTIVISFLTKPIDNKHLIRLTFPSRFEEGERVDIGETETTDSKPKVGVNEEGSVIPLTEINNKEEAEVQEADLEGQEDVTARNASFPWYKKAIYWICGVENMTSSSHDSDKPVEEADMSIDEDPRWSRWTNFSAVVVMIAAAFVWGFYA
ncbi:SLC5A9 [Bugula neritina]|uniref:SLC5A9 n=1 Tax=Bugula neritina TaxID=10212 RepID=A0A7J7KA10_BUGNE|nr:SLC5A9 [Bugula neritina]